MKKLLLIKMAALSAALTATMGIASCDFMGAPKIEIKKQKIYENATNKVKKVKRKIVIKYIIFFISSIIFIVLFWYYLSSFGAVYKNSQFYLIKNTFISFTLSLLYPFIINFLPGILRYISLNNKKMILYKISQFCQYL